MVGGIKDFFFHCAYTTSVSKFIKINKTYNTFMYKTNNRGENNIYHDIRFLLNITFT